MSQDHSSIRFDDHRTDVERYPTPDLADVGLVDVLRAAADPTRLGILRGLADGAEHPKGTIVTGLDCSESTAAHHFRTLREAGLTRTIVTGRTHTIQMRRSELEERFPGLIDAILAGPSPAVSGSRPERGRARG